MAAKFVEKYQVGWQHAAKVGTIVLLFQGSGFRQINNLPYESYSAMVDMLRNEKPIWYDENQSLLATIHEPVGEEEG
ncbi:MAG: hypothetical protein KDJ65_12195 [Anaerolineae bacterium]|nr:hypothetical protein [Anaerolineae bacterium]